MNFNPVESIGFLIRNAGRLLRNRVHHEIRGMGLNYTMEQGSILMRVGLKEGSTQQELAEFLEKDKTTIARIVNSMEKSSLIVRVSNKEDKRSKGIYLTQQGKEIRASFVQAIQKTLEEATQGIAEEDIETTKKVLINIHKNLFQFDDPTSIRD